MLALLWPLSFVINYGWQKGNKLWDLRATLALSKNVQGATWVIIAQFTTTLCVRYCRLLVITHFIRSTPHNATLFTYYQLMSHLFQVSIQSALSKFTTSISKSTSALAVNSFLIATKVNELDSKQSVSVSKTSFTQQYPANLSEMLIRGPILSAYTALIK